MRNNTISFKLGAKFIVTIVVILSITMGVSAYYMHNLQNITFFKNQEKQAQVQASFVSSISEEAILSHDYISLDHIVRELVELEDIVHSNITTDQGLVMTSYINKSDPRISSLYTDAEVINRTNIKGKLLYKENIFSSKQPILVNKDIVGYINIWVDKSRISELLDSSFYVQLINGVVIILAMSAFIYLVFRISVLTPIRNLMYGATQVAIGELDGEIAVTSNDELGILTNAFNTMTSNLRASLRKSNHSMNEIQSLNQNLEDIVQERTARLELSQKIALMGQWDYHPTNRNIEVSNEARNILGFKADDRITRCEIVKRIYLDDRRCLLQSFHNAFRLKTSFKIELRIAPPNSEVRYITIIARVDEKKDPVILFGIIQDITEQKKTEESARLALMEKSTAETANKAKSVFLANMSHEIRTPLAAIIGFSEVLLDNNVDPKQQEPLATICKNSNHLLKVINEILDLSKIESEKLEVEIIDVDICNIFAELESVMKVQASEKNIVIKFTHQFPLPHYIETDAVRLKQILFNLVDNAIKFTTDGVIRINVSYLEKDSLLKVEIVDSGIGISQDKLKRLFTPFTQADSSTTRRYGGTGLGLYISQQLVEMLGGSIKIASVPGLGTKICFFVSTGNIDPSKLINKPAPRTDIQSRQNNRNISPNINGQILMVDDSEDNRNLVQLLLSNTDVTIITATNGKEAIDIANRVKFDLVLMDMQMPIMDGIEATRRLRISGYTTPIIALTANAMKKEKQLCLDAGCNDFLSKPIERNNFYKTLEQNLTITTTSIDSDKFFDDELIQLEQEFVDGLKVITNNISEALTRNDFDFIQAECHKLKGIAGTYGYQPITDIAGQIETQLKTKNLHSIKTFIRNLLDLCEQAPQQFAEKYSTQKRTG